MFLIIKLVIAALIVAGIILFFGKFKKKPVSLIVGLCILALISSIVSEKIVEMIPRPTDTITLTATGEKNENALKNEVAIRCLELEGERLVLDNPAEGKWFWQGEYYMWRPETDSRKPGELTRSITLSLPVGLERELIFYNNAYRGIVEITHNGTTTRHDLYSESGVDYSVAIPTSESSLVYGYKLLNVLLFAVIICALMAFPCFAVMKKQENTIREWFRRNWDYLFYIALGVLFVIVLQRVSSKGSLWGDEVWTLGWMYKGYPNRTDLFYLLIKAWFEIMPYGQENLILLPQLCVVIAIFVAGATGRLVKGQRMGVLFSTLFASSLTVIYQCAMEYRPYPFLILFISLTVYFYVKKHKALGSEKYKDIILYSIFAVCAMDVHQFGFAVMCLLMFSDFILLLMKKESKRCWFQFVLPAIYGVYWISTTFVAGLAAVNSYSWAGTPTPEKVLNTVKWLSGNNDFLFAALILGAVIIVIDTIVAIKEKRFSFCQDYNNITFLLIPTAMIFIVYFYSTAINPRNSLFIDRYFIPIIIFVLYIIAFSLDRCIDSLSSVLSNKHTNQVLTSFVGAFLLMTGWFRVSEWCPYPAADRSKNADYLAVANCLLGCNDIYSPSVLVVIDDNEWADVGMDYYLTQKGKRDKINHCSILFLPENITDYDVLYVSYIRFGMKSNMKTVLDTYYTEVINDTQNKVKKYVRKSI